MFIFNMLLGLLTTTEAKFHAICFNVMATGGLDPICK